MLLSVIALNAGCATTGGSYCDIARPIWWANLADLETTPVDITRQVVRHNDQWVALCRM